MCHECVPRVQSVVTTAIRSFLRGPNALVSLIRSNGEATAAAVACKNCRRVFTVSLSCCLGVTEAVLICLVLIRFIKGKYVYGGVAANVFAILQRAAISIATSTRRRYGKRAFVWVKRDVVAIH